MNRTPDSRVLRFFFRPVVSLASRTVANSPRAPTVRPFVGPYEPWPCGTVTAVQVRPPSADRHRPSARTVRVTFFRPFFAVTFLA